VLTTALDGLSTLQMLTNIEAQLEELLGEIETMPQVRRGPLIAYGLHIDCILIAFDCILIGELETMPQEEVEIAERAKEKERRTRAREIKLELAIKAQEERIQRSIRRAQEPVKRREGKPIMFRSVLQVRKKKVVVKSDYNEEDDVNFYLGMGDD
jgi:hypothetical protein